MPNSLIHRVAVFTALLTTPCAAFAQAADEPCKDDPALVAELTYRLDGILGDHDAVRVKKGEIKIGYALDDDTDLKLKVNWDHLVPQNKDGQWTDPHFDWSEFLEEAYVKTHPVDELTLSLGRHAAAFGIRSARAHLDYHSNPMRKPQEIKRVTGATFGFEGSRAPWFLDELELSLFAHSIGSEKSDVGPGFSARGSVYVSPSTDVVGSVAVLDDHKHQTDTRTSLGVTHTRPEGTRVYAEWLNLDTPGVKSHNAVVAGVSASVGNLGHVMEVTYMDEGKLQLAPGLQWELGRGATIGATYRHTLCTGARDCRTDRAIAFQYQQKIKWD